jgi:hypothetical protein
MKRKLTTLCLVLALGGLVSAQGQHLDPTGTWKWTAPANPDGRIPDITFTLKLQGESLSGTRTSSTGTTPITDGVFKGDEIFFQNIRQGHAGKSTTTYTGRLSGDTIKGKLEIDARGQILSSDWEVKREAKPKTDGPK